MKYLKQLLVLFTLCASFAVHAQPINITQKSLQSGGYMFIHTQPFAIVDFADRTYQADAKGYLAIGFARDLSGVFELQTTDAQGNVKKQDIQIASREYNIQRVEGVPASRVTPPKNEALSKRIYDEASEVAKVRASSEDLDFWRTETFIWPTIGRITGVYGSQRFYNGIASSPHWGIDIAAPEGTPVYAPASGKIVLANPDLYYSGGTIILDHGGLVSSTFLHLSSLNVSEGQYVEQGELIGKIGSTGRSTGPHLDWRMNLQGVRIDAALWVDDQPMQP